LSGSDPDDVREVSRSVPKFYFHFSDGRRTFSDTQGVDLTGLGALRREAVRQIRDMKAAQLESGVHGSWPDWTVIAVDAGGAPVLHMTFDLKPKPLPARETLPAGRTD
jgi:hypothetical protein